MLSDFKLINRHRLWRLTHIVGAVFVLFYVFFQVLDLDLSDFPLREVSEERTVALTESSETTELTNAISEDSFRLVVLQVQPSFKESIAFRQKHFLRAGWLPDFRIRLHRLKIPRSSKSDASLAA